MTGFSQAERDAVAEILELAARYAERMAAAGRTTTAGEAVAYAQDEWWRARRVAADATTPADDPKNWPREP